MILEVLILILLVFGLIGLILLYYFFLRKVEPADTNVHNMMFIRPKNCHYCINGYDALKYAVDYADSKGIWWISDIQKEEAVKNTVYGHIDVVNPGSIYGFGHGSPTVYTGDDEKSIFSVLECSKLSGRIVYLLSCLTANLLGPSIISNGAKAYAGFRVSWTWITSSTDIDPYTDHYGKGYFESANELWISLCNGATFGEALQASVDKYNYWINYWLSGDDPIKEEVAKWLIHDRDGLVGLGNMSIKL